jgi:hypothetical protein
MPNQRLSRRQLLQTIVGATLLGKSARFLTPLLFAQTNTDQVRAILKQQIQTEDVAEFQLRHYLMKRVPRLPAPANAEAWTAEQRKLRKQVLEEIIFHGWPEEWVDSPPKFEDAGIIESGAGYRTRKLRFEIVPGFWSVALLYEPEKLISKVPATLNLNGHDPEGKAAEYKQKRCINNAVQGMLALSLEWLGMGELGCSENVHWFGAHLNLVGTCAAGLFYLAMRRGLDYLFEHANVDRSRIGVTGLSGGAWQTIVLSSLDERVGVAIPVSGYFAFTSAIERNSDVGDLEYNPPDFRVNFDYTILTAMRAPKPTLLIYGAEDEYGMRAPLEKPHLYDEIKPFYKLYGKEEAFAWHENVDPGTHNYHLDNRQQSYAFFTKHFKMPVVEHEIPVDGEIKSYEELRVGLERDNLTILGLAKNIAAQNKRELIPRDTASRTDWARSTRAKLKNVVRYKPVTVEHAWPVSSTSNRGLETISYRFEFSNELSATGVWLSSTTAPSSAPIAIVLDDDGIQTVRSEISEDPVNAPISSQRPASSIAWHLNRGHQVLAVNLIFTGDASPDKVGAPKELFSPSALYTQLIASIGDRPIGMEVAQLLGLAKWSQQNKGATRMFLETTGARSQVTALIAAALESTFFHQILNRNGIKTLRYLIDKPVRYQEAPDLFCLDLYKEFDIDSLTVLVEPAKVIQT